MGLLGKLFRGDAENPLSERTSAERNTLYAPVDGEIIALAKVEDEVFSSGAVGNGCGILPSNETVLAPCDGKVVMVADTKHAIGLTDRDGMEILIHVGLDTVEMDGRGFTVFVKKGDSVKCGQKLLRFNKESIKSAGYPDTTIIVVTNSADYQSVNVCADGIAQSGDKLITVH